MAKNPLEIEIAPIKATCVLINQYNDFLLIKLHHSV